VDALFGKKPADSYLGNAIRILERVMPIQRQRLRALSFLRLKLEKKEITTSPVKSDQHPSSHSRKPGSHDFDA